MSRRRRPSDPAIASNAPEQRRLPLTLQQQAQLIAASRAVAQAQHDANVVLAGVYAAASIGKARIVEAHIEDAVPYLVVQVLTDA